MLDGEVGDATPRIQPVRRHDGTGRAGIDTGRALAAVRRLRLRQRQRKIHVDLAEKEGRPCLAAQHQRVLATPALPAAAGQFGLQYRRRIGEHAMPERPDQRRDLVAQLLQPRTHHLVIVAPPGIDRHHRFARLRQPLQFALAPVIGRGRRQIVHARRDHAHRPRHQFGGPRPAQAVVGHVVHAAMEARLQPGQQARLRARQVHIGHTDAGKAQGLGLTADGGQ